MITDPRKNLGKVLKERRTSIPLTLEQLASASGVSISHLDRIEIGERFPSATVLRKISQPMGYEENELFVLAGYLTAHPARIGEKEAPYSASRIDPEVIKALEQEPVEVQRKVLDILKLMKGNASKASGKKSAKD